MSPQGGTLEDLRASLPANSLDELRSSLPPAPSLLERAGTEALGVAEQGIAGLARGVGTALQEAGSLGSRIGNVLMPGDTTAAERKRRIQRGGPVTAPLIQAGQELQADVSAAPPPEGIAQNIAAVGGQLAPAVLAPEAALPYFASLSAHSIESTYDETLSKTKSPAKAFEAALLEVPVQFAQFAAPLKAVGALGEPAAWATKVAGVLSKLSPRAQRVAVKMLEGAANGTLGIGSASIGHDVVANELGTEDLSVLDMAARAGKAAGTVPTAVR